VLLGAGSALAAPAPSWWAAAARGTQELMGSGDGSAVAWDPQTGLWGRHSGPHWWQSALAITTLVRYAERTDDRSPAIQRILVQTYQLNRGRKDFTNQYMDDTEWWGLAWLAASQYELHYLHDQEDAARFLATAEADATYVAAQPRPCGGIEWSVGTLPDTITNAEFVNLTAQLAAYRRAPGVLHDPARASSWLAQARAALSWLKGSGLINLAKGTVVDSMKSPGCQVYGYPITYTEGETADALLHMGLVLHNLGYLGQAQRFLRYTVTPGSGLIAHGVLEDHCQARAINCSGYPTQLDVTAFKGIFMLAMADWVGITRSSEFTPFLHVQAAAIVHHDIHWAQVTPPGCATPHRCQFGLSWDGGVPWMLVTPGTQESALDALIAVIR
jgi:hypothetical protein